MLPVISLRRHPFYSLIPPFSKTRVMKSQTSWRNFSSPTSAFNRNRRSPLLVISSAFFLIIFISVVLYIPVIPNFLHSEITHKNLHLFSPLSAIASRADSSSLLKHPRGHTRAPLVEHKNINHIPVNPKSPLSKSDGEQSTSKSPLLRETNAHPVTNALHPPSHLPHSCHVIGRDPNKNKSWLFNSRTVCMTSAICIRPSTSTSVPHLYSAADLDSTQCIMENPDLTATSVPFALNCTQIQQKRVHCAHGKYRSTNYPSCPERYSMSSLSKESNESARWIDDIAVVVPAFPYLQNIFHFSFVVGTVTQVVTSLPQLIRRHRSLPNSYRGPPRVAIVFRGEGPFTLGTWQHTIFDILVRRRMEAAGGMAITRIVLNEDPLGGSVGEPNNNRLVCAKSAALIGDRGHVNLWPFPNGTHVTRLGDAVPAEAVAFRRAIYDEFGIKSRLPALPDGGFGFPDRTKFDLPPLVLAYARRNSARDPKPGQFIRKTTRRFNDADDAWFTSMLYEEGKRASVEVREFKLEGKESVETQVRMFEGIGFLVGIHGANLVNALFMRPFSVLMEIHPGGSVLRCYQGGANSGLAYFNHEAEKATVKESNCEVWHKDCLRYFRNRRVKIGSEEHRVKIRNKVRAGLQHLRRLHEMYGSGIPVRYERGNKGVFSIDERLTA